MLDTRLDLQKTAYPRDNKTVSQLVSLIYDYYQSSRRGELLDSPKLIQPPRDEKLLEIVRPLLDKLVYKTMDLHVDISESTLNSMWDCVINKRGAMVISRHVGLTETYALPTIFYRLGLPEPYMVIGDNLIKGDSVVNWCKRSGLVFSERGNLDIEQAAENSRDKMTYVLKSGNFLGLYPTPGRSKNGLTMGFQSNPHRVALLLDSTLFPVSPGYYEYPEEDHFITKRKPHRRRQTKIQKIGGYTVKALHIPKILLKHKGDVYMNFGEPIIPSQLFGTNIPEEKIPEYSVLLADHMRKACLNLTPITERNIVAYAKSMGGPLRRNIAIVLDKVQPYSNRFAFRKMSDCSLEELPLENKISMLIYLADLEYKHPKLVTMYGNEIKHYVEGMYGRKYD